MAHTGGGQSQSPGEGEEKDRGKNGEADNGQRALPVFDKDTVKHSAGYLAAVGATAGVGFVFSDLPSFCR